MQSIPIAKLAGLAEMDADTLKQQLTLLRQSTQVNARCNGDVGAAAWCAVSCLPAHRTKHHCGWHDETRKHNHHLSHEPLGA